MKILVTGVAGFIGFNLANFLLKKNHYVYGIDNFDKYYSIKIKKHISNITFSNFYKTFYKTFDWYKKNEIHKF
tara:strand:- start:45 stop:263 length:219 start_codon:yes stop_codon:yes gene_type:complete